MGQSLSAREERDNVTLSLMKDEPLASQPKMVVRHENTLSKAYTVFVCLLFTIVGPVLILTNKYLMSRGNFPYPILLTCCGQISSMIITFILVRICKVVPLTPMPWSFYVRNVTTVSFAAGGAMALGNSTYLYLTVAFIEILKGFTPVVTMTVQAMAGQGYPRPAVSMAVLMISIGTAVSSFGEIDLNLVGVVLMLGSIYSEALRLMLTQRLLQDMRLHVLETLYYLSPATLFWLAPLALTIDLRHFDAQVVMSKLPYTWHYFLIASAIGFLVNTSSFLVIQRTNVVMLKLLAIARNALFVFSGIVFFEDKVTPIQFVGYTVTLVFFVVYNMLQFYPNACDRANRECR